MRASTRWLAAPLLLLSVGGAAGPQSGPTYTAGGDLIPPADYREWIYLSSGLDMSYADAAPMAGESMFDNVFVDPASWQGFKQTGHWPEHTMFVMESRGGGSQGSINKHGKFQTEEFMGAEVHLRDSARFQGGWGFFVLNGAAPAKLVPYDAACYACHQAHGAVDTTFTQFYPTAKPIAVAAGSYHEH